MRLAASLAFLRGASTKAKAEAQAAVHLDPSDRRTLAAIAARDTSAEKGLEVLGAVVTRLERQMQASLLFDAERATEAGVVVDGLVADDPDDPETLRLLAILRLTENRRAEARAAAERALELAPQNLMIIRARALVHYADAMSPLAPPLLVLSPTPGNPNLICSSNEAGIANLRAALQAFDQLAKRPEPEIGDKLWRLACLANLPGEREPASAACRELIGRDPGMVQAILWGVARDLDFDWPAAEATLGALYDQGTASDDQVRILGLLILNRDGPAAATARLASGLAQQTGEAKAAAKTWIAPGAPPPVDPDMPAPLAVGDAVAAAAASGDWSQVDADLKALLGGTVPNIMGLSVATAAGEHRRWRAVVPYVEALGRFETVQPAMLALFALHHAGSAEAVLDFIARHRTVFPGGRLPVEGRRMEMIATERVGDLPTALSLATGLVADTGAIVDSPLPRGHPHPGGPRPGCSARAPHGPRGRRDQAGSDRALRYSMAVTQGRPRPVEGPVALRHGRRASPRPFCFMPFPRATSSA